MKMTANQATMSLSWMAIAATLTTTHGFGYPRRLSMVSLGYTYRDMMKASSLQVSIMARDNDNFPESLGQGPDAIDKANEEYNKLKEFGNPAESLSADMIFAYPRLQDIKLLVPRPRNLPNNAFLTAFLPTTESSETPTTVSPPPSRSPSRGVNKMRVAGTTSVQRLAHASVGVMSLAVGAAHLGSTTLLVQGMARDIAPTEFVAVGALQILTAALGVTRLEWNAKELPRNAQIWPNPILNTWYLLLGLSQWGLGNQAVVDMYGGSIQALTLVFIGTLVYQSCMAYRSAGDSEIERQNSGYSFENGFLNFAGTVALYCAPYVASGLAVFAMQQLVEPGALNAFIASHPDYSNHVVHAALNCMIMNNFGVLVMTLKRYRVFPSVKFEMLSVAIPVTVLALANVVNVLTEDGGRAGSDLLHLLLQSM